MRNQLCQSQLLASDGPEPSTGCGDGQRAGLQERLTLNPEWPEVLMLMEVDTEDEGEGGSTSDVVGGVKPLSSLLPDSLHHRQRVSCVTC